MLSRSVAAALIPCLMFAGCTASTNERVFLRHEVSDRPLVRNAPYSGQYRVYPVAWGKPTTRSATPLLTRTLAKEAPIGFVRDERGGVVALSGDERIPLANAVTDTSAPVAGYTWTMQPDPGQFDAGKTALLVIGVAAVAAAALGVALAVSAAQSPWGIPTLFW